VQDVRLVGSHVLGVYSCDLLGGNRSKVRRVRWVLKCGDDAITTTG
jgi:hypothetical protein